MSVERGAARVLVVGRHAAMMSHARALLEAAAIPTIGVLTDEEAMETIASGDLAGLLLGGGVEGPSRARLASAFEARFPGRPVIEHAGGAYGLVDHVRRRLARS